MYNPLTKEEYKLLSQNKIIACIKNVMARYGCSLLKAKRIVDICSKPNWPELVMWHMDVADERERHLRVHQELSPRSVDLTVDEHRLLETEGKIACIKHVAERLGISMLSALNYVNSRVQKHQEDACARVQAQQDK